MNKNKPFSKNFELNFFSSDKFKNNNVLTSDFKNDFFILNSQFRRFDVKIE